MASACNLIIYSKSSFLDLIRFPFLVLRLIMDSHPILEPISKLPPPERGDI